VDSRFTIPQEIRDRIMDVNSDFQKKIVEYLESLCVGEFINGPKIDISERVGELRVVGLS